MRRKRREFSIFTLSFLDIMSCGFGAVVLLFMISKHAATQPVEMPSYDYAGEVSQLQREITATDSSIANLSASAAARGGELAAAGATAAAARQAFEEFKAKGLPTGGGGAREIDALKQSIRKLEVDKRTLLAQPHEKSRYIRSFVGAGNREYLTGVQLGGRRILILLDTSASMLDSSLVNVIRKRNMDDESQRRSPKWQQALATVDWIAAHFPAQSSYQIYAYNTQASAALPGTDGRWLPVKDLARLDAAVASLKQRLPAGGSSLERALMVLQQMNPAPDNVFLITDSLPTQGLEAPQGTTVSGIERQRLFEAAVRRVPGGIPINTILLPMEGDPMAPSAYWELARVTQGSFLSPSEDWP